MGISNTAVSYSCGSDGCQLHTGKSKLTRALHGHLGVSQMQ